MCLPVAVSLVIAGHGTLRNLSLSEVSSAHYTLLIAEEGPVQGMTSVVTYSGTDLVTKSSISGATLEVSHEVTLWAILRTFL